MKKHIKSIVISAGAAILAVTGLTVAAVHYPEVIRMETKDAYEKRVQPIVEFSHKKHFEEYNISCGECHHDESAEPLKDLKIGDPVATCLDCHQPGQADRKALRKLSKEERQATELEYHYGAIHKTCQGCHEAYNAEKAGDPRKGPAPVACAQCHLKQPKQ